MHYCQTGQNISKASSDYTDQIVKENSSDQIVKENSLLSSQCTSQRFHQDEQESEKQLLFYGTYERLDHWMEVNI